MTQTRVAPVSAATNEQGFLPGPGEPGLVSVIIPTYNRAKLIEGSIHSALAQTYENLEIIVVDDGSTDDTRAVVESFGEPVRYVYKQNGGVAAARNLGFRHARGEFVALLDSDDEWLPWKLEAQVRLMRENPELGMTWTDMAAISEQGDLLYERYLRTFYDAHELARIEDVCDTTGRLADVWKDAPADIAQATIYKGDIFSRIWLGNLVHTSTLLVRRERLRKAGEIDIEFTPRGEDYEFHLRICSHGPVGLIDAPSMLYRIGAPDQLTAPHMGIHTARSNLTTVLRWLERGKDRIKLPGRMVHNRLAQAYGWVGEAEMEFGDWKKGRTNLWKSLRYRPTHQRMLVLFAFSLMPAFVLHAARRVKRTLRGMRGMLASAQLGLLGAGEESALGFVIGFSEQILATGIVI